MILSNPSDIYVLSIPYRIERGGVEPGENGFCSPSKRVIGIREGLCEDEELQVFLHEVVHAVLAGLAYHDLYEDENFVQGMAIGLQNVIDSIVPRGRFCA